MPLASFSRILLDAQRGGYAVGGFNIQNMEMLQGVMAAAEAERAPVIVQFNPGNIRHAGMEYAVAMAATAARLATVPVAIHLDHGVDFAQAVQAVRAGFTSLMYDGTPYSFRANLEETRRVCEMAHAAGLGVEGEIGQMGGREEGVFTAPGTGTMSDPGEAEEYVRETGVDALAIAVGNVHGMTKAAATLDLERIEAIRRRVSVPLVIHGGSGVAEGVVRQAIARGVCKFNIATQLNSAMRDALAGLAAPYDDPNPRPALEAARTAVAAAAAARMRALGSSGRA